MKTSAIQNLLQTRNKLTQPTSNHMEVKLLSQKQIQPALEQSLKDYIEKQSSIVPLVFFNGALKSFITNSALMRIPVGQKGFNRGYGVKRAISVNSSRMSVAREINKLLASAADINLELQQFNKKELLDIYDDTIEISKDIIKTRIEPKSPHHYQNLKKLKIHIWITAGISDFSLITQKKQTQIYMLAYFQKFMIDNEKALPDKISSTCVYKKIQAQELLVSSQPEKFPIKSTNYFTNCYVATSVKTKGGYIGIHCNKDGEMLEGSMANVAFVLRDTKQFLLPSFDVTLPGTTSKRCLSLIQKFLIPEGLISSVRRESLHHKIAKQCASQILLLGGDACVPVLKLDGIEISAESGPVAKRLQQLLQKDKNAPSQ